MRKKPVRHASDPPHATLLAIIFLLVATTAGSYAQSSSTEAEAVRVRLTRARALAAAHNLAAAANELDAIRKTTTDDSVRDVARLMLMGICLEEGNYMRAQTLLEEMYAARSTQNESSAEAYFALAGQALNGAREHIERYRAFGINVADKDLPSDAISDLDRLRALLDRIANQAREMSVEESRATAATALLEDVSSLRATLARNNQERQQWQHEMASARQKLSAQEARITPVSAAVNTASRNVPARSDNSGLARNDPQSNSSENSSSRTAKVSPATNNADDSRGVQPQQPTAAANTGSSESVKPQDGKPVNVGSLIEKATQKINPSYPQSARTARITGLVTVYVEVDQAGAVSNVQTTSGPLLLRQAAADAARRWKFRPTVVGGQPVRVAGYINFNFTL